ncbi:MAG: BtrH N-terminal domain-containing protein [Desulfobacteraceae bacterium]|nr:BtrH N-terminal domain-containing protein [Desulfobacteraceae bacterium]
MAITKKILDGITFYPANYCINSALGTYLKYYDVDLFADIVGRYWEFVLGVDHGKGFFSEEMVRYRILPTINTYMELLEDKYGFCFTFKRLEKSKELLLDSVRDCVKNDLPVILGVDGYYLSHYDSYHQYHGLSWNHFIIVYGFDDATEEIYFLDLTRSFIDGPRHTLDYSIFYEAVFPQDDIYQLTVDMATIKMEKKILDTVASSAQQVGQTNVDGILKETDQEQIYFNQDALRQLAWEFEQLAASSDSYAREKLLAPILNQIILISQQRLANLQHWKKFNKSDVPQVEKSFRSWEKIKYVLSPRRRIDIAEKYQRCSVYINDIIKLEDRYYAT